MQQEQHLAHSVRQNPSVTAIFARQNRPICAILAQPVDVAPPTGSPPATPGAKVSPPLPRLMLITAPKLHPPAYPPLRILPEFAGFPADQPDVALCFI
jgi:hypothetical protein